MTLSPPQSQPHRTTWSFSGAQRLIFGDGALAELPAALQTLGAQRPMILTDANLVRSGAMGRLLQALQTAGWESTVFSEIEAEPSVETATRAVASARASRPDVVIGLGGGSVLDLSKIVAALATYRDTAPPELFGFHRVPGPTIPVVAIPTTAGTGSEVSHAAVLTDTENAMKVSSLSPYLRPAVALVDPTFTWTCPAKPTAESGIDALVHAVEAFLATDYQQMPIPVGTLAAYEGANPMGDLMAREAIRLIGGALAQAVEAPQDGTARRDMALAATYAGMAFSNGGVALIHALEYPLGGAHLCSHGGGNGLLLPYVLRFLAPYRSERIATIGVQLGACAPQTPIDEAVEATIEWIVALKRRIGIPARIRELGDCRDRLPEFAAKSFGIRRLMETTPYPVSETDLLNLLECAY